MAYHQWLSSTPKFHLTSSTPHAFSPSKTISSRHCPGSSVSFMEMHVDDQQVQRSLPPLQKDWMMHGVMDASKQAPADIIAGSFDDFPLFDDQTMTPPWQDCDMPLFADTAMKTYALTPAPDGSDVTAMSTQDSAISRRHGAVEPHLPMRPLEHVTPSTVQKKPIQHTVLPSPPQTPQDVAMPAPTSSLPPAAKRRTVDSDHPAKVVTFNGSCDPMMQTSTYPNYWSSNCTVLKADTSMEPGNVISPTCMVGLPFGGMVEMTLPLPDGEISGL